MEDSPIGLDKWMTAIWMLANCKNGISSYELGKTLGIRQNSAWFMLHRIREAMKDTALTSLAWVVRSKSTRPSSARILERCTRTASAKAHGGKGGYV